MDPFARRLGSGDARTPGPDAGDPQRRQHARIRDRVQCGAVPAVLGSSQQATSAAAQPDHRAPGVRRGSGEARWTWHCWQTTSGTLAATASWTSTRTCSANGSSRSVLRSMLASPLPPSRNSSSANRTALTRRSSSPSTAPAAICPAIATTCVGAGTRCRSRPARRGSRREAVRTAARLGRAPPARSPGTGAIPKLIRQADEAVRICAEIERAHRGQRPENRPTASRHGSRPRPHGPSGPAVAARGPRDHSTLTHGVDRRRLTLRGETGRAAVRHQYLRSQPARGAVLLPPRSISDQYCGDTPAQRATSCRVSPRLRRRARSS